MNIVISRQGQSIETLSACARPLISPGRMHGFQRRALLLLLLATSVPLTALGAGWQHVGEVRRVERLPDGIELVAGPARVRITAFHDGVIRVRLAPDGKFATDTSWTVVEQQSAPPVKIEETRDEVRMIAGRIVVCVNRSPLLITFLDSKESVLLADDSSLPMAWDGAHVRAWKKMPAEEFYKAATMVVKWSVAQNKWWARLDSSRIFGTKLRPETSGQGPTD